MNKIQILPDNIINQIAAGEVIENPSAVVKELIENSIDSGASDIKVVITKGGHSLVQVSDNGCGFSKEDLKIAFSRHATSKILDKEDLNNITTLGFRGEALPSIASVSRLSVLTSNGSDSSEMIIEGGEILKYEASAKNKGTEIKVKNLFYNTPARKKFLKSSSQETRNITKIIKRFVLSYPQISFFYQSEDKIVYDFHSVDLKQRIEQVFQKSYSDNIIEIDSVDEAVRIRGYIGNLNLLQRRRGAQYLFLNGRYINNSSIANSIRNCYDSIIQRGEFPFYVLFLDLPPNSFDVNVHPTKIEVRFSEKWSIINFIYKSIKIELKKVFKVLPDINFSSKIADSESDLKLDLELSGILESQSQDTITEKIDQENS